MDGLLTSGSIHNYMSPAQGTTLLLASLYLDDTTNAENVLTAQANWLICNRIANRAKVVVNLGYNGNQLVGNSGAHFLGNIAGQELSRVDCARKGARNAQRSAFIKFYVSR